MPDTKRKRFSSPDHTSEGDTRGPVCPRVTSTHSLACAASTPFGAVPWGGSAAIKPGAIPKLATATHNHKNILLISAPAVTNRTEIKRPLMRWVTISGHSSFLPWSVPASLTKASKDQVQ